MRRFLLLIVSLHFLLMLSAWNVPTGVEIKDFDVNTDYMSLMIKAAADGSENSMIMGTVYETQRNLKITNLELKMPVTEFFIKCKSVTEVQMEINRYLMTDALAESPLPEADVKVSEDVRIIATVVYNEAAYGTTQRHKELVAAVIMNRVNSDKFPDTVYDVVCQKGQYLPEYVIYNGGYHEKATSDKEMWVNCVEIAENAILGKIDCPENVLYQSNNFNLGSGYYEIYKTSYSTTYFAFG